MLGQAAEELEVVGVAGDDDDVVPGGHRIGDGHHHRIHRRRRGIRLRGERTLAQPAGLEPQRTVERGHVHQGEQSTEVEVVARMAGEQTLRQHGGGNHEIRHLSAQRTESCPAAGIPGHECLDAASVEHGDQGAARR